MPSPVSNHHPRDFFKRRDAGDRGPAPGREPRHGGGRDNGTGGPDGDSGRNLKKTSPLAILAAIVLVGLYQYFTGDSGGRKIDNPQHHVVTSRTEKGGSAEARADVRGVADREAGEIRMAAWNICWFPSGGPEPVSRSKERRATREAARFIRDVRPDILCAEEIRSREDAEALAKEVRDGGLENFRLAEISEFKNYDDTVGLQQIAIFTTLPVLAAASDRWHLVGAIDPLRGYTFALLDAPNGPLGVIAAHLKSNYIPEDHPNPEKQQRVNRLKREFASEQIRGLVRDMFADGRLPKGARVVVAGDFNTAVDKRWEGEKTLTAFLDNGWLSCYDGMAPEDCFTLEANPEFGYDAVTFDYIFLKDFDRGDFRATEVVRPPRWLSDHALVTLILR